LSRNDCENYSIAKIMQSFFSLITVTFSLSTAFPFLRDAAAAKGVAKRIFAIIDNKSDIDVFDDKNDGKILDKLEGSIEFENVFFSYPSRPEATVLKGLNLRIPAGKTVALVGSR
jgi:ATP-binding cassette, subfamily B (MDR/TAP), member 1